MVKVRPSCTFSEPVPDDILHPVVIAALGIHIELDIQRSAWLATPSNANQAASIIACS